MTNFWSMPKATPPGPVSSRSIIAPKALLRRLQAEGRDAQLSAISGQQLWGGQTLLQLAQLAVDAPEVMARSHWALSCKDYIRMRLTGIAFAAATDVSGSGLMDLATGASSLELFSQPDMPGVVQNLPPMIAKSAIGGVVNAAAAQSGLRIGTPLAGSMMDVAACALGAGSVNADSLVMIAGTWAINGFEVPLASKPGPQLPLMNMLHRDDGCRLLCEGSPSSTVNLGWFLERALGGRVSVAEANGLVAANPVQTRRCQFLPHIYGPAPQMGSFLDLTAADDTASLLRSIYEAVAFQHRRHAEDLLAHVNDTGPQTIRLAGVRRAAGLGRRSLPTSASFLSRLAKPRRLARWGYEKRTATRERET